MEERIYPRAADLLVMLKDTCGYLCRHISQEPEEALGYILKKIVKFMGGKAGNIRLFDKETNSLVLKASYGVSKRYQMAKLVLPVGRSIAGLAFQHRKVYAVPDLKRNSRYHLPEYAAKEEIVSLLCAPLFTAQKRFGVLSIYFGQPRRFTRLEREFFTAFAGFLATFLTVNIQNFLLRQSYLDVAKSLIVALEEKDAYTRGHSERVRGYAVKIAEKMGLPKREVRVLSDFGILHDIGKVIIDSTILNKSGNLTKEEWETVKKHPVIGARMVSPIDGFTPGIPIIKHHHERIDGKGYPNGLKEKALPLFVQIVTVADAFDAMTSPRAYRDALTLEEAKKELIKGAGKQFSEKAVKALIDLIDTGEITPPSRRG